MEIFDPKLDAFRREMHACWREAVCLNEKPTKA